MKRTTLCLLAALAFAPLAQADAGTTIDLSVDAQTEAPNDLGRASVYIEMQDANPAELARKVNTVIAAALATAAKFPAVKTKSGDMSTYPVFGKNRSIESWRMRSEILLESRELPKLSELMGKLQGTLTVGELQLQAAPETRKHAEDLAIKDALAAFQARAKLVAETLGKPYRITQLNVSTSGGMRPPRMAMMARAAPPPMEVAAPIAAGESTVQVVVSGKIELGR